LGGLRKKAPAPVQVAEAGRSKWKGGITFIGWFSDLL
jgi:hypothetical protein